MVSLVALGCGTDAGADESVAGYPWIEVSKPALIERVYGTGGDVEDGVSIAESTVICDYLESAFPEPALVPADPILQAHTRMIARMTDLYIAPHNTPLTRMRGTGQRDQEVIDTQAASVKRLE